MTDHDFADLFNQARARGGVAKMLHPLVLVITVPEYAATAPALNGGGVPVAADLPLPTATPATAPGGN